MHNVFFLNLFRTKGEVYGFTETGERTMKTINHRVGVLLGTVFLLLDCSSAFLERIACRKTLKELLRNFFTVPGNRSS
jgi:hypothetical protein